MVILFKSDKSLVVTSWARIFQKENLADKLNFYVPTFYDDNDISLFTATLFYKDGGNEVHKETLASVESDKDNYLKYSLPVTTDITKQAGMVELWMVLSYTDEAADPKSVEIHSDSVTIVVEKWDEYAISNSISEVVSMVETINEKLEKLISKLTPSEESDTPAEPGTDEPTEPDEPSEPTEPSDPTEPSEPTEPTDPTEPTEPSENTDPTEPTEPQDSTEPTEPSETSEPTDPEEPVEPTEPQEP